MQSGTRASLFACPSSFPASSVTYSDCSISGKANRVFNTSSGTLTLRSCDFTSCTYDGSSGGCIRATGTAMYIYSCSFASCKVTGRYNAGAIYCGADSNLTLEDSVVDSCCGWAGGAIFANDAGELVMRNCSFNNCTAISYGGAVGVWLGDPLTVTGCTFVSCTETTTGDAALGGGAILTEDATVTFSYCLFDSCTAANCGGAFDIFDTSSVVVYESEIRNCSASSAGGGAIACPRNSPSLTISYLTITDCTAGSSYGQAIHLSKCSSFKWDHLCITGSGTLVKSETSISVPTAQELVAGCPPATPSCSPSRSQS